MFAAFAMLIFIHFCALITPGPDFFLVSQTAISRSHKEAVAVVGGITVGVMFWSLLALLGLNILFEKMAWLKHVLLVCGGLYLCWLGVQMLRSAFSKQQPTTISPSVQVSKSMFSCFMKGMLTNLSNPKAVIYFGSVFSLFLTNPVLEVITIRKTAQGISKIRQERCHSILFSGATSIPSSFVHQKNKINASLHYAVFYLS